MNRYSFFTLTNRWDNESASKRRTLNDGTLKMPWMAYLGKEDTLGSDTEGETHANIVESHIQITAQSGTCRQ